MNNKLYEVKGMHCASCANIIEKTLKKTEGVSLVEVNYATETVKLSYDESKINVNNISKKIEPLGYSLVQKNDELSANEVGMSEKEHSTHLGIKQSKKEKIIELVRMRNLILLVVPTAIFSIFVMIWDVLSRIDFISEPSIFWMKLFGFIFPLLATYTFLLVGKPYLLGVYRFVRFGKANMDTLIGIGTGVAYIYSLIISFFGENLKNFVDISVTYYDVTIVVLVFITLGKYLETRSKLKTGDAIEKLLNLQAKTALVVRNGKEFEIPIEQVVHGDLVIVKPSGKIAVDGIVISGESFVDESMITGEPMPVSKKAGSSVVAGTINTSGAFTFKATKVGSETMLANIIKMVEDAQGSKAPIQALADKISSVFVPIVLAISVVTLVLWLIVGSNYLGFSQALSFGLVSFVGILVIACPCALGLATPTAIIVGVGKGAKEGILIKDARTLEKLHEIDTVVLDKTGTLTCGRPEVFSIKSFSNEDDKKIIEILASLENKSEHPIANAVITYARNNKVTLKEIERFESIKGKGLKGIINKVEYFAGNIKLIQDLGIVFDVKEIERETLEGKTPVILATKEKIIGMVMVADIIKKEAFDAISRLHKLGIKVVMLSGDNKNTAQYIANQVGIDEVLAEVLPEDKLNKIKDLQSEGRIVAMAGDGVNDAPALAQADVGIAMSTGTDVAIESSGITLLYGDISKLVKAINLSKITMRGIKQNLFWAFFYNVVGIPLASGLFYPIFGWLLSPIFAGMAMAFSSVSVVGNSLRIKAKKL